MMRRIWILALLLILAACGASEDGNQELPTRINADDLRLTGQPAPTEESPVDDPTPTREEVTDFGAQSAPTEESSQPSRPTLPPTWTPIPPTEVPTEIIPTATLADSGTTTIEQPPLQSEACLNYRVNIELTIDRFEFGESPIIAWTPVDGVGLYRVKVVDFTGANVHEQLVQEVSYQIPADVFYEGVEIYEWNVEPLDPVGIQMCTPRGGDLIMDN